MPQNNFYDNFGFGELQKVYPLFGETTPASDFSRPGWSPDGRQIAFISSLDEGLQPGEGLYLVNAVGTGLRRLANIDRTYGPVWSPAPEQAGAQ